MAKNYRHSGHTRNITPSSDVASGEVVASGGMVGVSIADIAANEMGVIKLSGVFRFTATAHGLAQGEEAHMILATQLFDDGTSGVSIGYVDEVVDANTIDVLLNGLPDAGR